VPPRSLRPVGIALVDKPAGPSSFAIVATLRRRSRARTGHAGTLDPFATGLLVLLSGAATRLAPCFVGLDKRYLADVELTSTTSTGDPEGSIVEEHVPPARAALERTLEGLRGEVELPIPAVSAVKIGGERAYKLARRGVTVEMPLRRSLVHALDVIAYNGEGETVESVQLALHVSSGTYVRAIAHALGGHCTSLRRTAVGPFELAEATRVEDAVLLPAGEALGRLDDPALERVPSTVRAGVLALEAAQGAAPGGSAA
jgi:tRNA pseudouridine55 synthase